MTKTKMKARSGFRVYEDALVLVRLMRVLWDRVGRHNRDLRRQIERAATSVPLNVAEGRHRRGAHGTERFDSAMASARECIAALQTSVAAGYLADEECEEAIDLADKIAATLWRCTHR